MSIKTPTKQQLIEAMALDKFKPMRVGSGCKWVPFPYDPERKSNEPQGYYEDIIGTPTDNVFAEHEGFWVRIYSHGRVTLDVGRGYCGELFDAQAKGRTLPIMRANAVKMLHGAIQRSGLN